MILLAQVGCGTQAQRQVNTGLVDAARPAVRRRRRSQPRQRRTTWTGSQCGNRDRIRKFLERPDVGRGRHGHPRRAATSRRQIMETYYRQAGPPGRRHPRRTRTTARCSRRRPTSRASSTSRPITSTAASTSRRCGKARPRSRTSRSRACSTKCGARCRPRARAGAVAPAGLQQQARTATRWRRGSRPARSAPSARCTTGPNRPFWPQGMQAYHDVRAARARRASTGRSGRAPSRIAPTTRATRSRCTAAGTPTAPAASATWATTACGSRTASSNLGVPEFVEARPNNDAFVDDDHVSDGGHVSQVALPEGEHRALAASRDGRPPVGRHVLVRRRHEAADAGGALRGRRGPRRRGHAVHRRQGQDPLRLPRQRAAAASRKRASRRSRDRSPRRTSIATTPEDEWVERDQATARSREGSFEQVAPLAEAVTLAGIALRVPYKRLLWDAGHDGVHELSRGQRARAARAVSPGLGRNHRMTGSLHLAAR